MASGIPRECRRLAEVDFPIAEVSKHAAREKPIVSRHPQSLHQWWARRPLASSRAMLLALLLPDPCDPLCPSAFKQEARAILREVRQPPASDAEMRKALLWFLGAFANWDMAGNPTYTRVARDLVRAAHGEEAPLVVDPFAGGGSIPLEALRLGCEPFASDLNPVACLILKIMLEDIPQQGPELVDELRLVASEIKDRAERELADLFPTDPDGATPVAYLWARTVRCEAPDCGAEVPILRGLWLSKKGASRARYFREGPNGRCKALLFADRPKGGPVNFRIATGHGSEEQRPGFIDLVGTKRKGNTASVVCPCCNVVIPGTRGNPRVASQLAANNGSTDVVFNGDGVRVGGARLIAVVTTEANRKGKSYRLPTPEDYRTVAVAQRRVQDLVQTWDPRSCSELCPVPDEQLPRIGTLGFRVQRYGMTHWRNLFTARQKLALISVCRTAQELPSSNRIGREFSALVLSRLSDRLASLVGWDVAGEKLGHVFNRQALPMVWDFCEGSILAGSSGSSDKVTGQILGGFEAVRDVGTRRGHVQVADAQDHPLPDQTAAVWFTDPPYYDAVPYADLSDFFLVWLKRALPDHPALRDPFDTANPLSPKNNEAVQDKSKRVGGREKNREWFEEAMARAFAEGSRLLRDDGVGSVVFAHKTTEGWEALLSGMIRGGLTITSSWPIATERPERLRARNSAALATSIHLVCRARPEEAPVGDWADVLRELPQRVGDWMERLQGEGIRGADLVFACIGPALEVFSRYRRVETPDGTTVGLPEYLEKVWEVVGRTALENVLGSEEAKARNGLAGALEEDSRLTALFFWTLQATAPTDDGKGKKMRADAGADEPTAIGAKGYSLAFDVVRRFAQPLGIDLPKWEKRIVETKKGVVRLLPIAERAKRLFGSSSTEDFANQLEQPGASLQLELLHAAQVSEQELTAAHGGRRSPEASGQRVEAGAEATTLDRVHTAMLLQRSGRTHALRSLVAAERERGPEFVRLANALSALYPRGSEEKRLLDAMLLAAPR